MPLFKLRADVTFEADHLGDAAAKLANHFTQISDEYYNGPDATEGEAIDMHSGGLWIEREATDVPSDPA